MSKELDHKTWTLKQNEYKNAPLSNDRFIKYFSGCESSSHRNHKNTEFFKRSITLITSSLDVGCINIDSE